jgi:hypothetical protein
MGIYDNGYIFGIKIYNFDNDDYANTLFEEKYEEIMSHQQMKEAYLFYTELKDKNNVRFQFYTECASTLNGYNNNKTFLMWHPMSMNTFLEKFNV